MLSPSPAYPPGFIEPCLPTLVRTVPDGSRWAFKHDGFRFIARRDGDRVRVFSRNAKGWTDRVPLIVEALRALPVTSATIPHLKSRPKQTRVTMRRRVRSPTETEARANSE